MKNYLDFEKEIKALEQEVDGLKLIKMGSKSVQRYLNLLITK